MQRAKCAQKQRATLCGVSNAFRHMGAVCAGVASGGGGAAASHCSRLGSLLSVQEMNFLRKFIALTLIEWRFFCCYFLFYSVCA